MKMMNNIPFLTVVLLLGLALIFKSNIANLIDRTNCTQLKFYQTELNICQNDGQKILNSQMDSISVVLESLELKFEKSQKLIKAYKEEIKKLQVSLPRTNRNDLQEINRSVENLEQQSKDLRVEFDKINPRVQIYKRAGVKILDGQ